MAFSSLNQHFDNHMCLFELFSQVNDVAHGPLVFWVFLEGGVSKYRFTLYLGSLLCILYNLYTQSWSFAIRVIDIHCFLSSLGMHG